MTDFKTGDYVEGCVVGSDRIVRGLYAGMSSLCPGSVMLWVADERSDSECDYCLPESIRRLSETDLDEKTAWHIRTGWAVLRKWD